jgi:hypothetical protein
MWGTAEAALSFCLKIPFHRHSLTGTSEDDGIHLKTLTLTHDPEDTDMKTQTRLSVHHLSSHHQTDG